MTSIHELPEPEYHVGNEQPTSTEEVNSDRDSISSVGSNVSVVLRRLGRKLTDLESRLHRSSSNLAKDNNTQSDSAYGSGANTPRTVLSPGNTTFVDDYSHDGSVNPSAPTSEASGSNPGSSGIGSAPQETTGVRTQDDFNNTSAGGNSHDPPSSEPSTPTGHQSIAQSSNSGDTPPSLPLDTRMAVHKDSGGPYPQNDHEEFDSDHQTYGLRPPRRRRKKSRKAQSSSTIPDHISVGSVSYLENIGSSRKYSLQRTRSVRRKPVPGSVRSVFESYERDLTDYLDNPYAETDERKLPTRLEWERGKLFPSVAVSPSLPATLQSSNDEPESNPPEVEAAPPVETSTGRVEPPSGRSSRASSLFEGFGKRFSSRSSLGRSASVDERPPEVSVDRASSFKRMWSSFKEWKSKKFPSRPEYDTPTGGYWHSGLNDQWFGDSSKRIPIKLAEYPEPSAPTGGGVETQITSQPPQTAEQSSIDPSGSGTTAEQSTEFVTPRDQELSAASYAPSSLQDGDIFWVDFDHISYDNRTPEPASGRQDFDTPMEFRSINDYLQEDKEKSIWTEDETKIYGPQITMGDQTNSQSYEPRLTLGDKTQSRETEISRRKEVIEQLRSQLEIEKGKLSNEESSVRI